MLHVHAKKVEVFGTQSHTLFCAVLGALTYPNWGPTVCKALSAQSIVV